MIKDINFIKNLSKEKSKRIYHIKYNYLRIDILNDIINELEKSKEKYKKDLKYNDKILEKSKLYHINELYILEINKKYIIIRNDEKSFFFNKFIIEINDYIKENNKNISLLNYIKNISNFIYIDELKFIILDIENDYILKS